MCLAWLVVSGHAAEETTLQRVRRTGELRWGADPSGGEPFVFTDPANPKREIGFEVEMVERIAGHLGVTAKLVPSDWAALPDSLIARRVDLIVNGLEVNAERARQVWFTVPYFRYRQQLTVRRGDRERYRTLEDLKGKPVAVLNGSAGVEVLKEAGWPDRLIVQLDDSLKPYEAVQAKRAEAALAESIIAAAYRARFEDLVSQPDTFSPGLYAMAVHNDDTDLHAELNRILALMMSNGELGEIYQRWGIWDDQQRELGTAMGRQQEGYVAGERRTDWGRIVLALLEGAALTLLLTAVSMPLALAAGLVLALMGRSKNPLLAWPARGYIQVVRGTPLLVQMYVIFFSLPKLGEWLGTEALTWPAFLVGVLCLSANYAAYEAEIHRAGIDAVPKGQREAALALGLSERQAFYSVVLPQSFRIILPPVLNDLISMLKDSCLVSVMGVSELLYVANTTGKATFQYAQLLLIAAAIYLLLSLIADWLGKRLEARLRRRGFSVVKEMAAY